MSSPTSDLLTLTHKYRAQTVTLIARQEALLSEQKAVFELERQLWATEREMWEAERSLLLRNQSVDEFQQESAKTVAQSERTRKRQSSGGGGIGWFLKQGSRQQTENHIDDVSPRNSRTASTEQSERSSNISKSASSRRQSLLSNKVEEEVEDEENIDDGDFSTIPPSLLAEASRLIYGDKPQAKGPLLIPPPPPRARQMSSPLPGNTRLAPKTLDTISKIESPVTSSGAFSFGSERSKSVSTSTAPSTNGITTKPQRTKRGTHYLASFSENSSEDDDESNENVEIQTAEEVVMPRTPLSTTFTIPPRYQPPQTVKKFHNPVKNDDDDDESDSPVPPLIIRSSGNFGSAFDSLKRSIPPRKPRTDRTLSNSSSINVHSARASSNKTFSVASSTTTTNANNTSFYHPETPVENIISFGTKGWKTIEASTALKASHDNLHSAYNNAGNQTTTLSSSSSSNTTTSNNIKSTELTLPSGWKGNTGPISPGQPSPSIFPYPPEPIRPPPPSSQRSSFSSSVSKRRSVGGSSVGSSSNNNSHTNHSDSGSGSRSGGSNSRNNNRRVSWDIGNNQTSTASATRSQPHSHSSTPILSPSPNITGAAVITTPPAATTSTTMSTSLEKVSNNNSDNVVAKHVNDNDAKNNSSNDKTLPNNTNNSIDAKETKTKPKEETSPTYTWNSSSRPEKSVTTTTATIPPPPPIPSTPSVTYPRISAVNPSGNTNGGIIALSLGSGVGLGLMNGSNNSKDQQQQQRDSTKRWGSDIAEIGGMI